MNYEVTTKLLDLLTPYIQNADISVSTENKDWRNRDYRSDLVTIDKVNHVGFEVFENEIIAFYFTDHYHFEDYSSELQEGQENYIERAQEFLLKLVQYQIRCIATFKGKRLSAEKYYFVYADGREDEYISRTWYSLARLLNPFLKKTTQTVTWNYEPVKGRFTIKQSKSTDPDAIKVIEISENCYIEILKKHNGYTYQIMELEFDDDGVYYWMPAANISPAGLYDTPERAAADAVNTLTASEK